MAEAWEHPPRGGTQWSRPVPELFLFPQGPPPPQGFLRHLRRLIESPGGC